MYCLNTFSYLFSFSFAATPNPPVITNMTSLSTSISLNWTHNKTCFENVPLEYHVVVNTDTQRIITGEMGTVISVVSGSAYTVSVMAVVDDSQRSEPDRKSVTAGGCRKDERKYSVCIYIYIYIYSDIQSLRSLHRCCQVFSLPCHSQLLTHCLG